jgi:hypothetical protein
LRISIAPNVLEDPRWFPILDVLLLIVEDDRHSLATEEVPDILASRWIDERSFDTRDFIRLAATSRSVDPLADRRTIIVDSNTRRGGSVDTDRTTTVHPLDAILFLSTPFQVIVENEWFDGGFMLWMAKGLGFTQLLHAYHKNRFVFRHAGGKDSIVRSAKMFSESVWPRPDRSTDRAFREWICVVLDNDARDPDDDPNRKIIEDAQPHVSFVHQLQRRSIESYLSQENLLKIDNRNPFRQRVAALFRMSPDQQRFYHMKRGFRFQRDTEPSKTNFLSSSEVTAGQKALYGNICANDWNLLMNGLGRGLSEIFVDPKKRPNTNQQDLVSAEARAELLNLFRSIYENM